MRFAWLFVLWSMAEIGLFVTLGGWIGLWATWGVVLGTGVLGILLIRWQKRSVLGQVVSDLQALRDPLTPAAHSAMIVLAGVLLILPGFLTDALGLVLLIPWVRDVVIGSLHERVRSAVVNRAAAAMLHPRQPVQDAVEVDVEDLDLGNPHPHKPSGWTQP